MNILKEFVQFWNWVVLIYFLIICTIYLILNLVSFKKIRTYIRSIEYLDYKKIFRLKYYKPISLIVPAFNEENSIVLSVKSLFQLEYPEYQIVVVNDGSKDNTLNALIENFSLQQVFFAVYKEIEYKTIRGIYLSSKYPSLIVIDKENGGKADAINAGINVAKYPLVTVIDADSILERDCLLKIARPFMEDENIIAAGGTIRIANGCNINKGHVVEVGLSNSWIARFQVVEYLRAFLFGRNSFDTINSVLIISGAFSCFRRDALIKVGGYRTGSIGEDMEIILRLHKMFRKDEPDKRISFIPDPVCWTEAPEKIEVLKSQRLRWQKGTVESLYLHRQLFFNYAYGWTGILVFPYFVIFEMCGPFIEISGYCLFIIAAVFNFLSLSFALAFLSVAILYGVALSVLSIILEELSFRRYPKNNDLIQLFFAAILENFGYRQLTTWWRFKANIEYLSGKRHWGKMEKQGLDNTK